MRHVFLFAGVLTLVGCSNAVSTEALVEAGQGTSTSTTRSTEHSGESESAASSLSATRATGQSSSDQTTTATTTATTASPTTASSPSGTATTVTSTRTETSTSETRATSSSRTASSGTSTSSTSTTTTTTSTSSSSYRCSEEGYEPIYATFAVTSATTRQPILDAVFTLPGGYEVNTYGSGATSGYYTANVEYPTNVQVSAPGYTPTLLYGVVNGDKFCGEIVSGSGIISVMLIPLVDGGTDAGADADSSTDGDAGTDGPPEDAGHNG